MTQIKESTEYRQRQIVEATRKIIATKGMEAITIREIAKEVGITDGDIYRHFKSKKEILLLLIEDIERTLFEAVEKAASEKRDSLDSLGNVLKAHLSHVEQRRGVSLIVIAEALRLSDRDLRERMFQVVNLYLARIRSILSEAVKSGKVSQGIDLDTAAFAFFALVHATVTLWALSSFSFSLAKKHKPLWEYYLASIAKEK